MIQRGQQAIFMCNGLFTSNRTLEQIFAQELKFLRSRGTAAGGDYESTASGEPSPSARPGAAPVMRAAFREGIGCVIMAPDQTFDDIDGLPQLDLPPPPGDPATIAVARWRPGRGRAASRRHRCAAALQAASDWAFNRDSRPNRSPSACSSCTRDGSSTSATRRAST